MQVVTSDLIKGKRVLLRLDLDVAIKDRQIIEDFKIKAGIPTLELCMQYASKVIIMGHLGRPDGLVIEELRVAPIVEWLKTQGFATDLSSGKLVVLENLRFDVREEACDLEYAKELASQGDFYINEAFSSYRPAVSTTILPTLLPHFAGLRFASEVKKLTEVRNNPKKPFIAILGGAKVIDKLPVIEVLAKKADAVLVGGKLIQEIREKQIELSKNVMVGKLNTDGFDIAEETTSAWANLISKAAMIVWNGPLGKFEEPQYHQTQKIIEAILDSNAEIVIGGGDSVAALSQYGMLEEAEQKALPAGRQVFVSVGGGAMLKLLSDGTLPTIEALN